MKSFLTRIIWAVVPLTFLLPRCENSNNRDVSFNDDVLPVFQAECIRCHNSEAASFNNLNLSSYESLMNGNSLHQENLVVAGYPDQSILYLSVTTEPPDVIGYRMPKDGPPYLDEFETQLIYDWIFQGAKDN